MVIAEALLVLAVARARIDYIEEQTEAEPIPLADTKPVAMETDIGNSNCPLDNSESLAVCCAPNVRK